MTGWTVTLEMQVTPAPTDDDIDELVDLVGDLLEGPAVSVGLDRPRVSVTCSVHEREAADALARAEQGFRTCLAKTWDPEAILDAAEVITFDEQDRRLDAPAFPPLAGVAEIADQLGVSKQRVSTLTRQRGFPAPVARLAAGPVWRAADLSTFTEAWERKPGRPASRA